MSGIGVLPLHGFPGRIVLSDIAHDFAFEVMSGREDAAGNEVAFNLREPQFDLVEPGRIGRREVQLDRRMVMKEHGDLPRLVCGEIIEDHMNGLPPRPMGHEIRQERDELARGVPLGGAPKDLPSPCVEGRIERQGPVPGIFKAVPFRPARGEGQDRIQPIQRLDRRFLIDAEDGGMLRRVQIQPNNLGRLVLEVGIVRRQVPLQPMRLEAMPSPDPGDHHMREPKHLRQPSRTPVGRPILRPAAGPVENPGFHLRSEHRGGLSTVPAVETGQALGRKASTPAGNVRIATAELSANLGPAGPFGEQQNTASAPGVIRAPFTTVAAAFEFSAFHIGQRHGVLLGGRPAYTNVSVVTIH